MGWRKKQIRELFQYYGVIETVELMCNEKTQESFGTCTIFFEDAEAAKRVNLLTFEIRACSQR